MLRFAAIAGTALLLALPAAALQQDQPAPAQRQQSGTKDQQQKKPEKKKSGAPANPFPQEQSEKAAAQQNQPQDPDVPSAPRPSSQRDQAPAKKPSTADRNPFPEAESKRAAHQQEQREDQREQATPPDVSGSDPNFSSSQVHLKGMEIAPAGQDDAPIQASSPLPYNPKLAKKDAQIGDYYLETGDYKGAYDRFVEAARSDPGNAEAVWGLAESAHRLQMNDVAIKNYRLYLAALPNGPHAKEIRKALKGMGLEPGS